MSKRFLIDGQIYFYDRPPDDERTYLWSEFDQAYRPFVDGDIVWDDLSREATAIPLQGQQGDPDRDTDGTLLFDASSVEQIALLYQMRHDWVRTNVKFHLHWGKTTDAAGSVLWQMRYRAWNLGAVPPAWSEWIDSTTMSEDPGATQKTVIYGFPEIPNAGNRASSMVSIQCRRKADDGTNDTYAADARLWDADIHYQRWKLGSEEEYPANA